MQERLKMDKTVLLVSKSSNNKSKSKSKRTRTRIGNRKIRDNNGHDLPTHTHTHDQKVRIWSLPSLCGGGCAERPRNQDGRDSF